MTLVVFRPKKVAAVAAGLAITAATTSSLSITTHTPIAL